MKEEEEDNGVLDANNEGAWKPKYIFKLPSTSYFLKIETLRIIFSSLADTVNEPSVLLVWEAPKATRTPAGTAEH